MPDLILPKKDQLVAVEKFRDKEGCLIGDEMGVGKTVTAIERDRQLREDHRYLAKAPTLIVCEKIGLDVWLYHLEAMGVMRGEILVIDPKDRAQFVRALEALREDLFAKIGGEYTYYIMHYDALRLVEDVMLKKPHPIRWFHIIADEVHYIKNPKAQRTKTFKKILTHYKTGCTGTPADDKPTDFWSPLNWLYPRLFRSYWKFYDDYMEYEEKYRHQRVRVGGRWVVKKTGYREVVGVQNIDRLHKEIAPFYIRRLLTEVEPDMPEVIHVQPPIMVDLLPAQRRAYDQMKTKSIARIQDMDDDSFIMVGDIPPIVSLRLRQMTLATVKADLGDIEAEDEPRFIFDNPSPKLDALMNVATNNDDVAFIVWTWFRGMADLIEAGCREHGISVGKIHGGVTSNRSDIVQRFQDGKDRVFVGTIAAAGKTITLTRAHHVIFTDRSPNPNRNAQAIARAWRRTQRNAVRVYDIQARNTVDQINWEKIQTKAQLIHAIQNPGAYT